MAQSPPPDQSVRRQGAAAARAAHRLLHRPLPPLPEELRQGPLREGTFTSPLHNPYVAAWLGYALGWAFLVCFLTGIVSHEVQQPQSWLPWPASPVWSYRATQGTHVITGLACLPLLLAKLWTVYPHFWSWPAARSAAHAVERLVLLLLVGGSLLQLLTGLSNVYQWYWFRFFFTPTHYDTAFVVMGALSVHVGSKIAIAREALRHPERHGGTERGPGAAQLARRRRAEARAAEAATVPDRPAGALPGDRPPAPGGHQAAPQWFLPVGDAGTSPARASAGAP